MVTFAVIEFAETPITLEMVVIDFHQVVGSLNIWGCLDILGFRSELLLVVFRNEATEFVNVDRLGMLSYVFDVEMLPDGDVGSLPG